MSQTLDEWLARTPETPLAPDLPICDPHHHLFDDPMGRRPLYLLDELRRDADGLSLLRTVFVDCMSHYFTEGPEAMRPVGETVFVRQVAEQSARTTGCHIAGIVGYVDMTLGDGAQAVLEAHLEAGGARFKGIRHATGWDPTPSIRSYRNQPGGMLLDANFRRGVACVARMGLSFDVQVHHHQLGARLSRTADRGQSHRRSPWHRPVCRQARRGVPPLARRDRRAGPPPKRNSQVGRRGDEHLWLWLARAPGPAQLGGVCQSYGALFSHLHRAARRRPLHV
jgi:hypothetical protein